MLEGEDPQKVSVGQPPLPRPQLDVIGHKPSANELLVIECKSYLDSPGVMAAGFHGQEDAKKDVYKLFNRARLRETVLACLVAQLRREGLFTDTDPTVRLVLVAGKIYARDEVKLRSLFAEKGWTFIGPRGCCGTPRLRGPWLRERCHHLRHQAPGAQQRVIATGASSGSKPFGAESTVPPRRCRRSRFRLSRC